MTEASILRAIVLALSADPGLLVIRRSVGATEEWDASTGRTRTIRYGVKGEPDLEVIIAPTGRSAWLEVKTATGRTRPEQLARHALLRRFGCFVAVVRSVDEAVQAIGRAREGATE